MKKDTLLKLAGLVVTVGVAGAVALGYKTPAARATNIEEDVRALQTLTSDHTTQLAVLAQIAHDTRGALQDLSDDVRDLAGKPRKRHGR